MNESLNKFVWTLRELEKELNRTPTNEEIGKRLNTSAHKIEELRTISRDPVSLDLPIGKDGESALGDLLQDRTMSSLTDAVFAKNVRAETADVLKTLSPSEEKVVRMRLESDSTASTRWKRSRRTLGLRASASGKSRARRGNICGVRRMRAGCGRCLASSKTDSVAKKMRGHVCDRLSFREVAG